MYKNRQIIHILKYICKFNLWLVQSNKKFFHLIKSPKYLSLLILRMHKLVKPSTEKKYVDLTVSFAPDADGDEDLPGPPVRYYFSHDTNE